MTRLASWSALSLACATALMGLGLGGSGSETVSWSAAPTVVRHGQPVIATGSVGSGRPGQLVTIQGLHCDQRSWRDVAETQTLHGGSWSVEFRPGITGLYRAASGGAQTPAVKLQQRPFIYFSQRPAGQFGISVQAQRPFWRRKARVERYAADRGRWLTVKTVLLTGQASGLGDPYIYTSSDRFRLAVPKGTSLRATLPLDQARPCYLAGYSAIIRR